MSYVVAVVFWKSRLGCLLSVDRWCLVDACKSSLNRIRPWILRWDWDWGRRRVWLQYRYWVGSWKLSNWSLNDLWLWSVDDVTFVPGWAFACLPLGKTAVEVDSRNTRVVSPSIMHLGRTAKALLTSRVQLQKKTQLWEVCGNRC
jgi:hypothetical protein